MINASPVRPLAPTSPSGLPTPPAAPAAVPPAPPQPPAGNTSTSSFTPQPKKRFSPKLILGLVVLLLAVIGGVAGLYLTQVNQDVRQQAAYQVAKTCPQVGGTCVIGACGGGQTPNSAVCGQSGWVCCMPGTGGGTTNTCTGPGVAASDTYQCQSGTSCLSGYTPVTTPGVTCGEPGIKTCCKPAEPATSCPVGSTKVENGPVGGGAGEFTCRCTISGQIVTPGGSCVATNCPAGTTPITSGVNIGKCNCPGGAGVNILPGEQCPSTGGPNPSGNPACTIQPLQRCTPGATTCCANGGVCQGVAGQEVCQVPTTSPNAQCGTGGTCTGWYGFKCTQLMTNADGNPECLENGQPFGTRSQAVAYAGSCGQVDQVCVGGPKAGQLCGDFSVFNQCGGGGGNPSPSPSTPIGPMCLNITMAVNGSAASATNKPKIGDRVTFTCGQVAGATRYRFRVIEPGGNRVNINGTGRVSQQYGVTVAGGFTAECSACTGADNSTCTDWPSRN